MGTPIKKTCGHRNVTPSINNPKDTHTRGEEEKDEEKSNELSQQKGLVCALGSHFEKKKQLYCTVCSCLYQLAVRWLMEKLCLHDHSPYIHTTYTLITQTTTCVSTYSTRALVVQQSISPNRSAVGISPQNMMGPVHAKSTWSSTRHKQQPKPFRVPALFDCRLTELLEYCIIR